MNLYSSQISHSSAMDSKYFNSCITLKALSISTIILITLIKIKTSSSMWDSMLVRSLFKKTYAIQKITGIKLLFFKNRLLLSHQIFGLSFKKCSRFTKIQFISLIYFKKTTLSINLFLLKIYQIKCRQTQIFIMGRRQRWIKMKFNISIWKKHFHKLEELLPWCLQFLEFLLGLFCLKYLKIKLNLRIYNNNK